MRHNEIRVRRRWIAAIAILVVVASVSLLVWYYLRVHEGSSSAIVTIYAISSGDYGTVQMRYEFELKGSNVEVHLGRRTDGSVFPYETMRKGGWIDKIFMGGGFTSAGPGEGSFELGQCLQADMVVAPKRIELNRGESFVLATCKNEYGERVELFVSCE